MISFGIRGNSCKAHSSECKMQMYIAMKIMEGEIRVRMRNIPRSVYIWDHIVPAMSRTSSSSENKQQDLPVKENVIYYRIFMIPISTYYYIKSISFV